MTFENQMLWNMLSYFVYTICKDRDESHGHSHMEEVAKNASKILKSDYPYNEKFYNDVIIVAWLHDVNDHKYDFDGKLKDKLQSFIDNELVLVNRSSTRLILDIIERISFSRENKQIIKGKSHDWEHVIGHYGIKIRNVVSDADKIEALGEIGLERCIEYAKEVYMKKFNREISHDELVKNVSTHADEKILLLKDKFIRTNHGKEMAEYAHNEFVECLEKFKA